MREELNKRYAALCTDLGNLHVNRAKIQKRIEAVEAEIEALDNLAASITPPPTPHPSSKLQQVNEQ